VTEILIGRLFSETSRKAEPGAGNRDQIRLVEVKKFMWRGALVLLLWSLTASRGANILFFHNMGTKYAEPVFLNVYGAQESILRNEFRQPT
jgi:hypothetical protein